MPVRVLAREDWQETLHGLGCKRHAGPNTLKTAELWETEDGLVFLVPIDNAEGRLRDDDLNTVLVQIAKLRDPQNRDPS